MLPGNLHIRLIPRIPRILTGVSLGGLRQQLTVEKALRYQYVVNPCLYLTARVELHDGVL